MRPIVLLFAVALAAITVWGCGGDSSDETLTKAEFIRRANAICLRHTHIIGPIDHYMRTHANSGESEDELTADAVRQTSLPQLQAQVDQISALGVPAGDEGEIERFLNSMQQAIDSLSQRQKIDLFTDIDEALTRPKLAAQSYGLTGCL